MILKHITPDDITVSAFSGIDTSAHLSNSEQPDIFNMHLNNFFSGF
jgi:hypothetical protein